MSEVSGLIRALARTAQAAGLDARFASEAADGWASATYVGTRHRIACHAADGPARATWLATLAEADFTVPGHLVADLTVVEADARRATIDALTLVDA